MLKEKEALARQLHILAPLEETHANIIREKENAHAAILKEKEALTKELLEKEETHANIVREKEKVHAAVLEEKEQLEHKRQTQLEEQVERELKDALAKQSAQLTSNFNVALGKARESAAAGGGGGGGGGGNGKGENGEKDVAKKLSDAIKETWNKANAKHKKDMEVRLLATEKKVREDATNKERVVQKAFQKKSEEALRIELNNEQSKKLNAMKLAWSKKEIDMDLNKRKSQKIEESSSLLDTSSKSKGKGRKKEEKSFNTTSTCSTISKFVFIFMVIFAIMFAMRMFQVSNECRLECSRFGPWAS